MEDKKPVIKLYSFTYGKAFFIFTLVAAAFCFLLGILLSICDHDARYLIPLFGGCLLLVLYSFWLIHAKYLNYITLTSTDISTKQQTFSWDEVYITLSSYLMHPSIRMEDYYIYFDDHYLSKEEICSRRVKKDAFYLMVTPKRLEIILQNYTKKIQLLDRRGIDRIKLYDKVLEYNQAIDKSQEID